MSEISLAKRAMLVSISIKLEGLLGERRDKQASSLVTSTYTVAENRAKASKYLINRKHQSVKSVVAAAQQIRATVYRYTFPWGDSTLRLLPAKAYGEFKLQLDRDIVNLNAALDSYYTFYPFLVKQSEFELGALFDFAQYPSLEQIKDMFWVSVGYLPMPETGNFIAEIAQDAADHARETIIQQTRDATQDAFFDVVQRVERTVKSLVDSLTAYKPKTRHDEKVQGIFRDSLIENVKDISRLISTLNFTEDHKIDKLSKELDRLAVYSAEILRINAGMRATIIQDGQALLEKLESFKKSEQEVDDIVADMHHYA